MFQNYIRVAIRNILKHKFYSALNIGGLGFGLTASFLIGLYIYDDLNFDRFHTDIDNIYCVGLHGKIGGQEVLTSNTCPPLAQEMKGLIPGVEEAVRINTWNNVVMRSGDKVFTESDAILVDSNFFEFFSFRLLEGDVKTALKEPYTMVVTKQAAVRYFGSEPAMGKMITVGIDNKAYAITGIAEEAPPNSEIQFDMILSASSDENMVKGGWTNNGLFTYIKKNPLTTTESVNEKLREFVMKNVSPVLEQAMGINFAEFEKNGGIYAYYMYPMASSHLYQSAMNDSISPRGDIKYVYIMGAVGAFILLIACINFMNLSTARSASRGKEVGLRKTLGSSRSRLIGQFMSESFAYTLAGTALAIAAVYLLLPYFNLLSAKQLTFGMMLEPALLGSVVIIFLFVSLLAGSYPAFYLTSFNPIEVLKGKVRAGMRSKGIRSALVVLQFTISIGLIISTLVVYNQLNYLQDKNIGMDKQNVLIVRNTRRLASNLDAFKESLKNQNGIIDASYTNNVFPGVNNTTVFTLKGTKGDRIMGTYYADYDHLNTLKMEMLTGRYFSRDFPSDSTACVINEAAVAEMGNIEAIGQKLTNYDGDGPVDYTIVGIVKDFNFETFKLKVRPMVIRLTPSANNILIRYEGMAGDAIAKVEEQWKKLAANEPFEYAFLDQNFDQLFREEKQLGLLFSVMTGIAIFVACLGLLGLASFTAEQRTKEIGIRKVMGASVSSVSVMLSREFMALVGISFVAATVLSWYFMNDWLSTFAFRIELGAAVFLVGGILAASIAWLTVSYHFIKAARSNPADSLRYE